MRVHLRVLTWPQLLVAFACVPALEGDRDGDGHRRLPPQEPAPPDEAVVQEPHDAGVSLRDAPAADTTAPDLSSIVPDAIRIEAGGAPTPLPVLWIEVDRKPIPKGTKIPGRLRIIEDHDGGFELDSSFRLEDRAAMLARPTALVTEIGIEIRGNTSAILPKTSFSVELRNAIGADAPAPVLGMPAESDWVLHGCYSDKTCLRNALTYSIGRQLGRYNVRTRFAEVFIDNDYRGLYLVVEKIKQGKNRVGLPKPAADKAAGDLTGGYIFKHDYPSDGTATEWLSKKKVSWAFHDPNYNLVTPAQKVYLRDFVDQFEAMMSGPDWAHPTIGYRAWVDVPSWVDFVLAQELTNNIDSYSGSSFLYKQRHADGNLLFAGPLWDFDFAYGNCKVPAYPHCGRTDMLNSAPIPSHPVLSTLVPFFWWKIWRDPYFMSQLRCRWDQLRPGPLSEVSIDATIDTWVGQLAGAVRRNQQRWKSIGVYVYPNDYVGQTYAEEVKWFRDWISGRLRWLDQNLPGVCVP